MAANKGAGLLPWSWVAERMAKARNYWVATTRPDGAPHVMPVWGLWLNDAFWFSTGRTSRKAKDLAKNPRMVAHLESGDEVVVLEGVAVEADDAAALKQFAADYQKKYKVAVNVTPEGRKNGPIFMLRTQRAFAWRESDYPGSATRWRFTPPHPERSEGSAPSPRRKPTTKRK